MTMTAEPIIEAAWTMIGDVGATKRNPIADMVALMNDALQDACSRRNYMLLSATGTFEAIPTITVGNYNSQALPSSFTEAKVEAMAHYLAYRIFQIDANDEEHMRLANIHYQQYLSLL